MAAALLLALLHTVPALFLPGPQPQQAHDFCGEAALSYILAVEGRSYSQEEIHEDLLGLKGVSRGAYSREITEALEKKGYRLIITEEYSPEEPGVLSAEESASLGSVFRKALDRGHPVFIGWYPWKDRENGKRGHFSVLCGYAGEDFFLYDPRFGGHVLMIPLKALVSHLFLPTLDRQAWGLFYFYVEQAP